MPLPTYFRAPLALLMAALMPSLAEAGDLVVTLHTPKGLPIADAVVTVEAPFSSPIHLPWPARMAQRHMTFEPFVLVVPVGAEVAFPNNDDVRHHVYSFSPAKTFELKLYGRDQTRTVRFDKVGVVEIECNIHDSMIAFIDVVDTPWVAKTDEHGRAVVRGVPGGARAVRVWRPYLRAPGSSLTSRAVIGRDGETRLDLNADVRPPPAPSAAY